MAAERVSKEIQVQPEDKGVPIDPQTLIQGNYAFDAVDSTIYGKMAGPKFKPSLYNRIRATVIRVANPKNPRGFEYFTYDGHHRIKAAQSFIEWNHSPAAKGDPRADPNFKFKVEDITDELIDKYPGQEHFTREQALKEVIAPTEQHKTIASHRIAAHILTEWDKRFQDSPASHYSVLAALSMIKGDAHPKRGEDPAAVDFLEESISGIRSLVIETGIGMDDVLYHAFRTIARLDESPDNPAAAENHSSKQRQIHGLLNLSNIDDKLHADQPSETLLADRQEELTSVLSSALVESASNRTQLREFRKAITDENLSLYYLVKVLRGPGENYVYEGKKNEKDERLLSVRYQQVKHSINVRNIESFYENKHTGEKLSTWESVLAWNLCKGKDILPIAEVTERANTIRSTRAIFGQTETFIRELDVAARHLPQESRVLALSARLKKERLRLAGVTKIGSVENVKDDLSRLLSANKQAIAEERARFEPVTVFEAPASAPRTREQEIVSFSDMLDQPGGFTNEELGQLGAISEKIARIRSQPEKQEAIDWNRVLVNVQNDGTVGWFRSRLNNVAKPELKEQDRKKMTRIVDLQIRGMFPSLGNDWDTILSAIHDHEGNTGMDAIHSSLSNPLARISSRLQWDKNTPQFKYLSASHYLHSINATISDLKDKQIRETITDPEKRQLEILQRAGAKIDGSLQGYTATLFKAQTSMYTDLLHYALYMPYDNLDEVFKYLASRNSNSDTERSLLAPLQANPRMATVEDLFRNKVLVNPASVKLSS